MNIASLAMDAYQHTGTVDSASAICTWVHTGEYIPVCAPLGAQTYTQLYLVANKQTIQMRAGDWIIKKDDGSFNILTDLEFKCTYLAKEDVLSIQSPKDLVDKVQSIVANHEDYTTKVNNDELDQMIRTSDYYTFPGTRMTVCLLTLQNGFHILGYHNSGSSPTTDTQNQSAAFCRACDKLQQHMLYAKLLGSPLN